MTNSDTQEPEGTTLNVYSFVVKKGEPVGPREVMRGVNLSTPSLAYWHLQKLENLGLLQKNKTGEYVVKEKTSISGHVRIGVHLVPRLIFYSLFFLGVIIFEVAILFVQFFSDSAEFSLPIVYLLVTNIVAFALFLGEGLLLRKKIQR
jgi:ABC-type multidrug transport system fused ATPase/permease subunit